MDGPRSIDPRVIRRLDLVIVLLVVLVAVEIGPAVLAYAGPWLRYLGIGSGVLVASMWLLSAVWGLDSPASRDGS